MSFNKTHNPLINVVLFVIAIGIVLGTGSLYRFIYSYNLIMFVTLVLMALVISYQYFIPSFSKNSSILQYQSVSISYQGLLLISVMLFFVYLSDIINKVESLEILIFYSTILILSTLLDDEFRNKIFKYYLIVIVILSGISIIFTILNILNFDLNVLPHVSTDITNADFFYVWSGHPALTFSRNQSIFWEPGAFGYHIIVATLLSYKNNNKFFTSILIVTAITTFSTTVYFFLFLLFLYTIAFSKNRVKLIGFSILILLFVIIIFGDVIEKNPIYKLIYTAIFEKFTLGTSTFISFAGRTLYIIEAFKIFLDNIFLGVGQYSTVKLDAVRIGAAVNSSGLIGLIAELGFLGIFCIFLYIRFFNYFKIFAIPIALIWLNGEFLQYSPLSLFILADSANRFAKKIFP